MFWMHCGHPDLLRAIARIPLVQGVNLYDRCTSGRNDPYGVMFG